MSDDRARRRRPPILPSAVAMVLALSAGPLAAQACQLGEKNLCLNQGRFAVEVSWEDFEGNTGTGRAIPLTDDSGAFWFFQPTNLELLVKVLDARLFSDHFWVFYGALSNVEYTLTVTDTATGEQAVYFNPSGQFASVGDTAAFPAHGDPVAAPASRAPFPAPAFDALPGSAIGSGAGPPGCIPGGQRLCLNQGRFAVEVSWEDFQGKTGVGQALPLTGEEGDTGAFWFFDPDNLELVVKVLDGRLLTGHFWVFFGALSNVEYTVTVTDTETGRRKTYFNPSEHFASVGDTQALTGRPLPGVGFTPRHFASIDLPWVTLENVEEHFAELEELGLGIFAINGEWYEVLASDGSLLPGFDEVLAAYPGLRSRVVGMLQFVELGCGVPRLDPSWQGPATWETWNAHDGWEHLTEAARRFAERQRPPFLGIGVEINQLARNYPTEFERFAAEVFPGVVESVAEVSPDTVVFPGFQFEWTMGDLRGFAHHNEGFGCEPEPGVDLECEGCVPFPEINSLSGRHYPSMVDAFALFPPEALTHLGFTTYPYFNRDFATPADLPDDYYSRLYDLLPESHRGLHLVLSESGWPANEELSPGQACLLCTSFQRPASTATCFPEVEPDDLCTLEFMQGSADFLRDWLGGEAEQADFALRFAELVEGLRPSLVFWSLLHDPDERNPAMLDGLFTHIGFRTHDGGETRPSMPLWLQRWAPR